MGWNVSGMAAAFQGYQDEQRRIQDDEQRTKAAQRLDQDATFQEEARSRQRKEWARTDKNQALDDADLAELSASLKTGNSEASKPLVPQPAGIPQTSPTAVASLSKVDNAMAKTAANAAAPSTVAPTAPAAATTPASNAVAPAPLVNNSAAQPQTENATPVTPAAAATSAGVGLMNKLDAVADNASVQVAAASPAKPAPARNASVIPQPAGIPKPHDFNNVLDMQQELLNRRLARGSLSTQDYANSFIALGKMKSEGIHQALDLMVQGDYQGGVDAYNSMGRMRGARVVEGKEGVTKINGQDTPTHFVTIENADGTRTIMDVTKARYQLMDIDRQLQHQDAAAKNQMLRDQHADQLKFNYAKMAQESKSAAASNSVQAAHLALQQAQFNATTPAGMIAAREKALGRSLNNEERATLLGIDSMPQATKLQVTSLLKEQDQLSQAMNKAMAEGTWKASEKKGDVEIANPLLVRQGELQSRLAALLDPVGRKDVGNLRTSSTGSAPNATATLNKPENTPANKPLLPTVGGILGAPPATPATTPVIDRPRDYASAQKLALQRFSDIGKDTQLQALLAQSKAAIASGQRVAANNALQRYNALCDERYPVSKYRVTFRDQ